MWCKALVEHKCICCVLGKPRISTFSYTIMLFLPQSLLMACEMGNVDEVQRLLRENTSVSCKDKVCAALRNH